jgi:hypothetical protein
MASRETLLGIQGSHGIHFHLHLVFKDLFCKCFPTRSNLENNTMGGFQQFHQNPTSTCILIHLLRLRIFAFSFQLG